VVEPAELHGAALTWCEDLARLAPLAVSAMKRALNGLADGSIEAAELDALAATCAGSEDLREGLAAQREGREPRFARR
jgi:enoyl-CoA hydratase/carnithine racemase